MAVIHVVTTNTVTTKVLRCNHSCTGNSTTTLYSNTAVSGEFIETYLLMCPQLIYEDTGSPIMILLLFAHKTLDHCFLHKRAIFSTSVPNKFGTEPSLKNSQDNRGGGREHYYTRIRSASI